VSDGTFAPRQGPLAGLRVIDASNTFMVPYATLLLAQMGAEVIKIEPPGGDILRQVGETLDTRASPIFLNANRGKLSVVLDLRVQSEYDRLISLLRRTDVFVHNKPPAAARRLRIDYESLAGVNARLIYCAAFGYGSDGPYRDRPAYDDTIQAEAGFASIQTHGGEPQYVRTVVTDKATGLFVIGAILAALYERERSGQGQAIEVPMFESMISFLLLEQQGGRVFDPPRGPTGYVRTSSPHRHPYRTADGLIAVMVYTDAHCRALFDEIGRPELNADERFATMRARTANTDALYAILEQELVRRSTVDWLRVFEFLAIPAARVNSIADLLEDPHVLATGLLEHVDHPIAGRICSAGLPIRFSRSKTAPIGPAPLLDEHRHLVEPASSPGMGIAEL
jgi:crotonobetainyl-CoA:carnitine CoA-transferase CaiB-like acyl-CoA transferase